MWGFSRGYLGPPLHATGLLWNFLRVGCVSSIRNRSRTCFPRGLARAVILRVPHIRLRAAGARSLDGCGTFPNTYSHLNAVDFLRGKRMKFKASDSLSSLLLHLRRRIQRRPNQKMPLSPILHFQTHSLIPKNQSQVISLSRLRRQLHRLPDPLRRLLKRSRLPLRANIVFPRWDLKKEIRLPIIRPYPIPIDSHTHRRRTQKIHKKIHQHFSIFGLSTGCFVSSVFTSNITWLGPHPAAVRAVAAWSCANAGDATRKITRINFFMTASTA